MLRAEAQETSEAVAGGNAISATGATGADSPDDALIGAIDETLARYNATIRRAIEAAEGPGRLTMPQLRCLQAMERAGESRTSQLARTLNVTAPTMTSMIDGLVERGLVARQPHPTDRRQMHLLLTDAGRDTLSRYRTITHDRLAAPVARLSPAQRDRLLAAMADMRAALDTDDLRVPPGRGDAGNKERS